MEKRLALNITTNHFCNQKCFFCIDNTKEHLTFLKQDIDEKIYKMIDDWKWKYENIVFTSWEPTLNKNFWEYIKYAKESWYKNITMISNGSLLDIESVREKIINSWLDEIVISIHWLWAVHDKMVGVDWIFNKTLKGLYSLLKEKDKGLKISLSFVMNKYNIKVYYKYIDFFINLWVDQIIINTLRPEGYSSWYNYKKYFFPYSEFIKTTNNLWEDKITYLNNLINNNKLVVTDMLHCIMKQAWLVLKWVWKVEIRKSFSSENWKKSFNNLKTYESINNNELDDDNNLIKTFIDKCDSCRLKSECEWIYIDYLDNFWNSNIIWIYD